LFVVQVLATEPPPAPALLPLCGAQLPAGIPCASHSANGAITASESNAPGGIGLPMPRMVSSETPATVREGSDGADAINSARVVSNGGVPTDGP
jgi:hypothetical protein